MKTKLKPRWHSVPEGTRITIATTEKSLLYKFLTIVIYRTQSEARVMKSRFMYGQNSKGYYLRILGVLHGWFGLTLSLDKITKDNEEV